MALVAGGLMLLAPMALPAQEFFRCTSADGKVTYQQAPCTNTETQTRIDATPANTDFDPAKREQILKQGDEAGRRLEERAAQEREEARRREEEQLKREREAQEREAAREMPVYVIGGPGYVPSQPLPRPLPPARPKPTPPPPSYRP